MFQEAPIRLNNFGEWRFFFCNNSIKLFEEFNNLKIQVLTTFEDILKVNINKDIEAIDEEQQTHGTDLEFILLMSYFKILLFQIVHFIGGAIWLNKEK